MEVGPTKGHADPGMDYRILIRDNENRREREKRRTISDVSLSII